MHIRHGCGHVMESQGLQPMGQLAKLLPMWIKPKRNGKASLEGMNVDGRLMSGNTSNSTFLLPDVYSLRPLPADTSCQDCLAPAPMQVAVIAIREPHLTSVSLYVHLFFIPSLPQPGFLDQSCNGHGGIYTYIFHVGACANVCACMPVSSLVTL